MHLQMSVSSLPVREKSPGSSWLLIRIVLDRRPLVTKKIDQQKETNVGYDDKNWINTD